MHVVVIGAGIVGLTTAHALVEAGHDVEVIDRADGPATGASARNGAQLSYSFVTPLASAATLRGLPTMLLDAESPLRFRPDWSRDTLRWCWQFLRACNAAQATRTTRTLLELAARSREGFARWRDGMPADAIDHRRNGKLVLFRSDAAWRSAQAQLDHQAQWGPPQQALTPAECRQREPALADGLPLSGGVFTPSEEVADCALVCNRLATELEQSGTCEFRWQAEAFGWQRQTGRIAAVRLRKGADIRHLAADAFVVANGVDAGPLLSTLGFRLPIAALKGYSIELPADALMAMPTHSVTDSAAKTVYAPLGAESSGRVRLRIAGMAELVGNDMDIEPRRVAQLLAAADACFGLRRRPDELHAWVGLRPATPTGLPIIGRAGSWRNLYTNAGHGGLGFTLAFGSAERLLDAMRSAPR